MNINYTIFINSIICFLIPGIISYFTFPLVNKFALHFGFIDNPSPRKQHNFPIARIGGISIVLGFFLTILITNFLIPNLFNYFLSHDAKFTYLFIGSIMMFFLGFADDINGLSPWSRLVGQTIISSILWSKGVSLNSISLDNIGILDHTFYFNTYASYFISVIWLVGITNAFNWIDGLDGLAVGIAFISSISFMIIFKKFNSSDLIYLSSVMAGSSLGFLLNNFHPAKIFMGDGGAYFIGFSLGALSLYDFNNNLSNQSFLFCALVLTLPLLDMASVIFRRVINGRSPFFPDKTHFHHYLLKRGFNHTNTVLILYFLSFIFSFFTILIMKI